MDIGENKSVKIPNFDDPKHKDLAKQCRSSTPMGVFRTGRKEFLLCYNDFGLFVNQTGDPIDDKPLIQWQTKAERVVWHPPYVLIITSRSIEVRTVETGQLCQIIKGEDIRITWDGRGTAKPPPAFPHEGQSWADVSSLETHIHGVMRVSAPVNADGQPVAHQHIFELVPTAQPSKQ